MLERAPWIAWLLLALATIAAQAQVSPGPLSDAHAHLEGMRHCRDCHAGGDDGLDTKCLECHQDLARTLELDRGLHAREGRTDCADCHPEHAGRSFDLIDWGDTGREGFQHHRTGYLLDGAHAAARCESCHRPENRVAALELRRPENADDSTYLGLDPSCRACHQDIHEGRLGVDCSTCHSTTAWKEVGSFDHARTGYPLRGEHAKLECMKCHENGRFGTTTREGATRHLAPIDAAECSACHRDVHQGRFGPTCSRCHVTAGFRQVSAATFDHDRTRYPLRGAHVKVECGRCHEEQRGGWGPKPAFAACGDCHADAHAGTATRAGNVVDCAACHEVRGFVPSTFGVEDHAASSFPLTGKHEATPCSKCHARTDSPAAGSARVDLRPSATACTSCHEPAHGTQFAEASHGGACDVCHGTAGWRPVSYGTREHATTGFSLTGAHAAARCESCHHVERAGLPTFAATIDHGTAPWVFRGVERMCVECHVDVHRGRYGASGDAAGLGPCESCHDTRAFRPSTIGIDAHDEYGFALQGDHRVTPCVFCHAGLGDPSVVAPEAHALVDETPVPADVVLWDVPTSCVSCHGSKEQE